MRLSVRVSDDIAQQLSAISAARGTDLSTIAREALATYLAAPSGDRSPLSPLGRALCGPHDNEHVPRYRSR
jgi:hypothetical protein